MNGGFEQPVGIGIGGIGAGICPPGTRCVGASAFGACLGTCVPSGAASLPGGPQIIAGATPIGPIYGANGQVVAGVRPKRRRMNYSNQKALRRALRRATGYSRQQKAIRKVASEFAREFGPKTRRPRRDVVVPRHTQVR
jgi:hypothetical protein